MLETRFQNSVSKFLVSHVVLSNGTKKKIQIGQQNNEGEVAFFCDFSRTDAHTDGRTLGRTHIRIHVRSTELWYGARFIVPSRTSFGGNKKRDHLKIALRKQFCSKFRFITKCSQGEQNGYRATRPLWIYP